MSVKLLPKTLSYAFSSEKLNIDVLILFLKVLLKPYEPDKKRTTDSG